MPGENEELKLWMQPTEGCLSFEDLHDFLQNRLAEERSARVQAHLESCPRCMTEVSLLREFESGAPRPEEEEAVAWIVGRLRERSSDVVGAPAEVSRRRGWRTKGWIVGLTVTTALLLAVAGRMLFERSRSIPGPSIDSTPGVLRAERMEIVSPSGNLDRAPALLRWKPMQRAARYEARILEVDRTVLWKGESDRPEILLPQEIRATIVPGKTLLWYVTAHDLSGRQIAASEVISFRVELAAR